MGATSLRQVRVLPGARDGRGAAGRPACGAKLKNILVGGWILIIKWFNSYVVNYDDGGVYEPNKEPLFTTSGNVNIYLALL